MWKAVPDFTQDASLRPVAVDSESPSSRDSSAFGSCLPNLGPRCPASLTASASVDLLEFTNTRHCPPSSTAWTTRDDTASSLWGTCLSVRSPKTILPGRYEPSISGTGRQSLLTREACSQSARSSALDIVADSAMTCRSLLRRIILVRATSRVGPLPGSCIMWISSAMTSLTSSIQRLPWRIMESAFSEVAMTMSAFSRPLSSESRSPVLMWTFIPRSEKRRKSSLFSEARALSGTMYRTRPLCSTRVLRAAT